MCGSGTLFFRVRGMQGWAVGFAAVVAGGDEFAGIDDGVVTFAVTGGLETQSRGWHRVKASSASSPRRWC
jgi:hypothetical protein